MRYHGDRRAAGAIDEGDQLGAERLREAAAREVIEQFKRQFPWMDALAAEANLTLIRTYGALSNELAAHLGRAGLSEARFNVLRLLYYAPERRLLMSEIGAGLNVTRTNITKLIDGLERAGFVRRVSHPEDRRMIYAELTEAGLSRFEAMLPEHWKRIGVLWSGLSDEEKRELIRLVTKLRVGLLADSTAD